MIPRRIEGATRYLGAPKGWNPEVGGDCAHLAIADLQMDGGMPVMVSAWEPTPAELAALQGGAPVYLQVCGTAHPPVNVWVGNADAPDPYEGHDAREGMDWSNLDAPAPDSPPHSTKEPDHGE